MNKQNKNIFLSFQDRLYSEVLWWRVELTKHGDRIKFSEAMFIKYGLRDMLLKQFVDLIPEPEKQLFESLFYCLRDNALSNQNPDRLMLPLKLARRLRFFQCQIYCERAVDESCIWAQCIEISERVDFEQALIQAQSQMAFKVLQQEADVSRKRQLESEEKFVQQSVFLSMLSHELRSPLLGMSQVLQSTKKSLDDKSVLLQNLSLLGITVEQLMFMVNDILTFSQNQHQYLQLNESPFVLDEMLNYVTHLTKSIARERNMVVTAINQVGHVCFKGDVLRISQILINLIVNGIKYTRYGGVFIKVKAKGRFIEFKVIDSGIGIATEKIDVIFAPYSQLNEGLVQRYLGSGLGLSVVKLLVDLLQGEIQVTSTLGVGSTFTVLLPLEAVECQNIELIEPRKETESVYSIESLLKHGSQKVLIADDSLINRKVLQQMLEGFGCQVVAAENGSQAYEFFKKEDFNLVFLDMQMPQMNGCEAAKAILNFIEVNQQIARNKKPFKLIALTAAHTEIELESMAITVDKTLFDAWLIKPITTDQIMNLLLDEGVLSDSGDESRYDGGEDFLKTLPGALQKLFPELVVSLGGELRNLWELLEKLEFDRLKSNAHKVKGSVMLFGWQEMLMHFQGLEDAIHKKDISDIREKLYNIQSILLKFEENK